ncbi:MAG TPA: amino acid ABC transporter substrate-binding protein [Stellaceae bacterium]|nr:amino acid ABC transporter substrate-binding protein [Stellaceae bacterium]
MIRKQPAWLLAVALVCGLAGSSGAQAQDKQPITIGFGMGLTGGLAAAGKSALLAMQIWQDDVNAKGGIMGRPVKLIYYDDQSNPSTVPALYTKLLDVDKVDFIVSGYGTNLCAPAMPVAIQHDRLFLGLFALAVNSEFHYPKYFSMLPAGPDPKHSFSEPFFKVAMAANPKPKTLALLAEDSEFPKNASEGIHDFVKQYGLQLVYDKTYPPGTPDFTPIVHAIQATNPDMVFVASYPPGSAGMLRAATESGLKTRFFGGGMVGLQYTPFKQQFGTKLNGIVDYDWWIPAPTMQFPGILDFLKKYQAKAGSEGVDPLGWYLPPFAYANLQVLGDAIEGTKSTDQTKVADYIRSHPFKTIVGDISFGQDGEWSKPRVLEVQWQGIKGNTIDDFKDTKTEAILAPDEYKTGTVVEPYDGSK